MIRTKELWSKQRQFINEKFIKIKKKKKNLYITVGVLIKFLEILGKIAINTSDRRLQLSDAWAWSKDKKNKGAFFELRY